ncbi:MAG: hypothetical protein EBW46_12665 [Rhodobacterales bacterium]|nr:hypothetical protein [Rhodobacterales bacterium]
MSYDRTFETIISQVIEHEGGYVNDPNDRGGETNFGIAKRWFPELDIKNLTKHQAIDIYYHSYWKPSKADQLPEDLKATYFDMCVNMGQSQAVKVLQKAINSKKRTKIAEDGMIGPNTIEHSLWKKGLIYVAKNCRPYITNMNAPDGLIWFEKSYIIGNLNDFEQQSIS